GSTQRPVLRAPVLCVAGDDMIRVQTAGGVVAVGMLGGDGNDAGAPGSAGRGKAGNDQAAGGGRVDGDAALAAGDRARNGIGGAQGREGVGWGGGAGGVGGRVGGCECVGSRQGGVGCGAGACDLGGEVGGDCVV